MSVVLWLWVCQCVLFGAWGALLWLHIRLRREYDTLRRSFNLLVLNDRRREDRRLGP
jgi:hypothetical protein